jgi:ABC-type glycerol-3-phosphate transport system permease component
VLPETGAMADDRSTIVQKILTYGALALVLALILIPYLYVIVTAFKPPGEIYDTTWLPRAISVQAWRDVFVFNHFHVHLLNSLIAGVGSALLAVAISLPGAYIFARKEFPLREPFFYLIVGTLIFPFILLIVPITITWIKVGLFDTFLGLWLAFQIFAVPYSMWILRGYFAQLPRYLEEAAMVYGCTQFQAFYRVMLPLAKPVIVSVLFLAFLQGWSDFLFSNMLTTGDGPRTASVAIYVATAGGERIEWELLMVMTLITGIPPVILYMLAQRHLSKTFAGAGH